MSSTADRALAVSKTPVCWITTLHSGGEGIDAVRETGAAAAARHAGATCAPRMLQTAGMSATRALDTPAGLVCRLALAPPGTPMSTAVLLRGADRVVICDLVVLPVGVPLRLRNKGGAIVVP